MDFVRIGTRGSKLALWQANDLRTKLSHSGVDSELVIIATQGDQIQDLSLSKLEGKGFFTTEIEEALRSEQIDVAVHSLKDLPTASAEGLALAGLSSRAAPEDVLIIPADRYATGEIWNLKKNARVGTSSNRRKCWLRHYRPDVEAVDIRGNVPTRIDKLHDGNLNLDAIVLAAAGIERLGIDLTDNNIVHLHKSEFIPAPAQGVIGYQIKQSNKHIHRLIYSISDQQIHRCTNVERRILSLLEGGCHSPIGAYCHIDSLGYYHAAAAYAPEWKDTPQFARASSATTLGLAEDIVKQLKQIP